MLGIINQVFEIDKKATENKLDTFKRNTDRLYYEFEEMGYKIVNPLGAVYDPRDTWAEANIVSDKNTEMFITKVIKPAVYKTDGTAYQLIQKAIVIVE